MPLFADYEPERRGEPTPAGLTTRAATPDDLPVLAAIRAARDEMPVEAAMAVFARQLASAAAGRGLVLAAVFDAAPVGYGVVERLAIPGLPEGCYLSGVVVAPSHRRQGIGARLTQERLDWVAARDRRAYYFTNERNRVSVDLHARFGFRELVRDLQVPGLTFSNGVGLLFGVDLAAPSGA